MICFEDSKTVVNQNFCFVICFEDSKTVVNQNSSQVFFSLLHDIALFDPNEYHTDLCN